MMSDQPYGFCEYEDCDQEAVYCSGHAGEFVADALNVKDRRIAKLEAENERLRTDRNNLLCALQQIAEIDKALPHRGVSISLAVRIAEQAIAAAAQEITTDSSQCKHNFSAATFVCMYCGKDMDEYLRENAVERPIFNGKDEFE